MMPSIPGTHQIIYIKCMYVRRIVSCHFGEVATSGLVRELSELPVADRPDRAHAGRRCCRESGHKRHHRKKTTLGHLYARLALRAPIPEKSE